MHYKRPRLWRAPLRSRRVGLVHACDSSRRPTRICQLADPSHPPSRRLEKAAPYKRSSSDSSAVINGVSFRTVRIRILQLLAPPALVCIPLDKQDTYAAIIEIAGDTPAATAVWPAFVFGGVGYLHRWSQNDQYEFTPERQEDLDLLARHTAAKMPGPTALRQRCRRQNLRLFGFD